MTILDIEALRHATVFREPFRFLVADRLIRREALPGLRADFPAIRQPGLFPLTELEYGPSFEALVDELLGPDVHELLEQALEVDLAGRTRMVTVRGWCRERDGAIHKDSEDKVASALLYLNDDWDAEGGRLRLVRGPFDIYDVVAEVPPTAGAFVAFRRGDNSWHGHLPYAGPRRYVMINWMADASVAAREIERHRLSARTKQLLRW